MITNNPYAAWRDIHIPINTKNPKLTDVLLAYGRRVWSDNVMKYIPPAEDEQ